MKMEFLFFIHPEGEVLLLCKSLKIRVIRDYLYPHLPLYQNY